MRLWILSDLHFTKADARAGRWPHATPAADVAVVAGDICEGVEDAIDWLARTITLEMPVVFVLGNHELYGEEMPTALRVARAYADRVSGLHLLDDSAVEIGGVRFLGGTLWTDYRIQSHGERAGQIAAMRTAASRVSDHSQIWMEPARPGFVARNFAPSDALEQHRLSRAYIEDQFTGIHDGPTVVVTHHAPHPLSIGPRWVADATTPAFVSDLSSLIDRGQPTLWVHGHTHASFDYSIDPLEGRSTRVICNPRGYSEDENPTFDPALVVQI